MTDIRVLRSIQYRDPDGWDQEPTEADYNKHKSWAITTYGEEAWYDYNHTDWAER